MKRILLTFLAMAVTGGLWAQQPEVTAEEGYRFTIVKEVGVTPVKDQSRSGTCWSFAGNAFLESELLRMGKGEYDLSEMWIVRHTYLDKAIKYVRMHGKTEFGAGGALEDVINVYRKYGIVPQEVYRGMNYGMDNHNHAELDAILEGYVKAVVSAPGRILTTAWIEGINGILDAYFGKLPDTFQYKGKTYDAKSFAASLGLDMNDYVSITSFTHHPFYTQFALEIPDNWAWSPSWNLPLDEFMQVFDYSLDNGYSVCWGSDVSEKGFAWMKGLAVVPEANTESMDGTELARWVTLTDREKDAALYKFDKPGMEKQIDQQMRQIAFDNYETTDDHGMLITGTAVDQNGNRYYRVKNSWGTGTHVYDGYFYASRPFVEYKTINIIVNKKGIPAAIAAKIGLR